jgi:hypothetical protein
MIVNKSTSMDCDTFLESFSAELTVAAYAIALRQGTRSSWIDLELELWKDLTETVQKWGRALRWTRRPFAFNVLQEEFLLELTDAAYRAALRQEMRGSFLSAELGMYDAFRSLIEDYQPEPNLPDFIYH